MASDTQAWVATEGRTVEVLAEASRRLGAARDRDEIYAAACDATLALLAPDRHAGVAVLAWSTDGLSVVRAEGVLAQCGSACLALDELPELTRAALEAGEPVSQSGGHAIFGLHSPGPAHSDQLLLTPIARRGRPRHVLAAAGTSVGDASYAIAVVADIVGFALDADQRGWADAVIEGSQDIVLVLEADGAIRTVNAAVQRILGLDTEALAGVPIVDLVHPSDAEALLMWLTRAATDGRAHALDIRCRYAGGGWVDLEATATAMLEVPDVRGVVVNLRDVRERKTLEAELSHWAFHDPLTNLTNRAGLRERITGALERADRTGTRPAVLLVDLDDFKAVNDSLGHQEGDRLLIVVAERLRNCTRASDTLARLGGDEFVVVVDDEAVAESLAERIHDALDPPVALPGVEVHAHASIGIRVADADACDVDQLLRDADLAMYAAKASGKATWRRFHPDMHEQVQQELTTRTELRRAVERNEFVLLYQPIVRVDTEQVVGFEALIRWRHPTHGLTSPDKFIPQAEQTGLIIPIGAWVVRQACAAAMIMRKAAGREIAMSVNVSPRQLHHDDIVDIVRDALDESGLPPASLSLEITESVLADDVALIDRLRALRDIGLHLAIDDFGTGFSSYGHLQRLPIDTIKIDRSFVDRLAINEPTPALARSIIRMSQSLGLRTVAEGVENVEQQAALRELGCLFAQGFLFSRPIAMSAAIALLEHPISALLPPAE